VPAAKIDPPSRELTVALDAARAAADISRGYFRGNFSVRTKADRTPVTQADIECEQTIRTIILDAFPSHGFYGEETGHTRSDSPYLWLVDPIDGTKGFVRQYPFFSTQIALMHDDDIVLGVSSGTMFDELAWAERGRGAWLNGAAMRVSDITELAMAAVSSGNLKSLAESGGWSSFAKVVATADRIRGYGDFYHYHLLASGKIDAVIESDVNILDIAALSVIVSEAGGVFTDMNGRQPGLDTRSVLAANTELHAQLLSQLSGYVS
jgi:histidinol-phosphatase